MTTPFNKASKYEVYSNDARFSLAPMTIAPTQAHWFTQFLLIPYGTVMVNYVNDETGSLQGIIGLNVTIQENGVEVAKTFTDINGKVAVYVKKEDVGKELTYNFTTFDLANRYKVKTDIIVRKVNEN